MCLTAYTPPSPKSHIYWPSPLPLWSSFWELSERLSLRLSSHLPPNKNLQLLCCALFLVDKSLFFKPPVQKLPYYFSDPLTAWRIWCKLSTHLTHLPSPAFTLHLLLSTNALECWASGQYIQRSIQGMCEKVPEVLYQGNLKKERPSQKLGRMFNLDCLEE